jgi:ethanolamine utilization protein EutA (predicted chaperonin)
MTTMTVVCSWMRAPMAVRGSPDRSASTSFIDFTFDFSRLTLWRQGIALQAAVVVNREILHESPILLTLVDKTTIDTDKLAEFIHESYRQVD